MTVTLFGGPLDGLKMELPEPVDKLLIVDDRSRVHRYETDGEWSVIKAREGGECVETGADMRLTDNPEEFDAELRAAIGSNWRDAI